jgi:hypothetical protein
MNRYYYYVTSLPCELQLVARPTVAHTGGYLFIKRGSRDPFCKHSGTNSRASRQRFFTFVLVRLSVLDPAVGPFSRRRTSEVPVMFLAGFDPETLRFMSR